MCLQQVLRYLVPCLSPSHRVWHSNEAKKHPLLKKKKKLIEPGGNRWGSTVLGVRKLAGHRWFRQIRFEERLRYFPITGRRICFLLIGENFSRTTNGDRLLTPGAVLEPTMPKKPVGPHPEMTSWLSVLVRVPGALQFTAKLAPISLGKRGAWEIRA